MSKDKTKKLETLLAAITDVLKDPNIPIKRLVLDYDVSAQPKALQETSTESIEAKEERRRQHIAKVNALNAAINEYRLRAKNLDGKVLSTLAQISKVVGKKKFEVLKHLIKLGEDGLIQTINEEFNTEIEGTEYKFAVKFVDFDQLSDAEDKLEEANRLFPKSESSNILIALRDTIKFPESEDMMTPMATPEN